MAERADIFNDPEIFMRELCKSLQDHEFRQVVRELIDEAERNDARIVALVDSASINQDLLDNDIQLPLSPATLMAESPLTRVPTTTQLRGKPRKSPVAMKARKVHPKPSSTSSSHHAQQLGHRVDRGIFDDAASIRYFHHDYAVRTTAAQAHLRDNNHDHFGAAAMAGPYAFNPEVNHQIPFMQSSTTLQPFLPFASDDVSGSFGTMLNYSSASHLTTQNAFNHMRAGPSTLETEPDIQLVDYEPMTASEAAHLRVVANGLVLPSDNTPLPPCSNEDIRALGFSALV